MHNISGMILAAMEAEQSEKALQCDEQPSYHQMQPAAPSFDTSNFPSDWLH